MIVVVIIALPQTGGVRNSRWKRRGHLPFVIARVTCLVPNQRPEVSCEYPTVHPRQRTVPAHSKPSPAFADSIELYTHPSTSSIVLSPALALSFTTPSREVSAAAERLLEMWTWSPAMRCDAMPFGVDTCYEPRQQQPSATRRDGFVSAKALGLSQTLMRMLLLQLPSGQEPNAASVFLPREDVLGQVHSTPRRIARHGHCKPHPHLQLLALP